MTIRSLRSRKASAHFSSRSTHSAHAALAAVAVAASALVAPGVARAAGERTLEDFRYFRALSVDLQGRIPTRAEVTAFEDPAFDLDAFIDAHLEGSAYSERLQRVYMDALRLEVGESFRYVQNANVLRRYPVLVDNGDGTTSMHWVYWRRGQRRAGALDRNFCFTAAETGSAYPAGRAPAPDLPPTAVPLATFQARTKAVKPWWMYRDYRAANPTSFYSKWSATEPRFVLHEPKERKGAAASARDDRMFVAPDGSPMTSVFTCAEEAQETVQATVKVRGQNVDVACATGTGYQNASECGCGKGLEGCTPGTGYANDPQAMVLPTLAPLGVALPFETARQQQGTWWRGAWGEEVRRFFDGLFLEDRDFRDVLTAKYGWMNGPTAQFYRNVAAGSCCNDLSTLGPTGVEYLKAETVVDPAKVPADLVATEMDRWVKVDDRGPHASGILTMPAFLAKFASRRGRAHAVYTAFLCKDFVAENLQLQPSTEPNLMIRSGCSTCHATLEPMSAYFTRTKESSFDWLKLPIDNPTCALKPDGTMTDACEKYYDPSFSTAAVARLRGSYGSVANAEKGPAGLASEVVSSPDFAACAARTVTESMLGRRAEGADDVVLQAATAAFADGGYRMRPLVRAIVKSNAYRNANATLVQTGGAK